MARKMDKFTNTPTEISTYIEILPNKLYFAVLKSCYATKLKNNMDTLFFTIDNELVYQNYYCDFGPLNLSCLYKYCVKLNKYLHYAKGLKTVVHYTCNHPEKKANAACLIGAYCVIYLRSDPQDTWRVLQELGAFKPYVDASQYPCGFTLRILDVLLALNKALTFNFFDFHDFDINEYDMYDKLQHGDMNWLVPRKFLAFIGPCENGAGHRPEFYVKYFLKNDVKTVIRLNAAAYNPSVFFQMGIQHYDLIYPDGAIPPREILLKFLAISEMAPAAIAVHCKAGLGRTGSLIGAYLIKHYHLSAKEAIAWMRLCRPGSVIGQQQIWLEKIENWLWRTGNQYRVKKYGASERIPRHRYGIYSKQWMVERNKIIAQARTRLQTNFTKCQIDQLTKAKQPSSTECIDKSNKKLLPTQSTYGNMSKMLASIHSENINKAKQTHSDGIKYMGYMSPLCTGHHAIEGTQGDKLNEKKVTWYGER